MLHEHQTLSAHLAHIALAASDKNTMTSKEQPLNTQVPPSLSGPRPPGSRKPEAAAPAWLNPQMGKAAEGRPIFIHRHVQKPAGSHRQASLLTQAARSREVTSCCRPSLSGVWLEYLPAARLFSEAVHEKKVTDSIRCSFRRVPAAPDHAHHSTGPLRGSGAPTPLGGGVQGRARARG